jgi:hypothetical protein
MWSRVWKMLHTLLHPMLVHIHIYANALTPTFKHGTTSYPMSIDVAATVAANVAANVAQMQKKEMEMVQYLQFDASPSPSALALLRTANIASIFGHAKNCRIYLKVKLVKQFVKLFPWFLVEHPSGFRYRENNFSVQDQELFRTALCKFAERHSRKKNRR